jgi:hypothetical protein
VATFPLTEERVLTLLRKALVTASPDIASQPWTIDRIALALAELIGADTAESIDADTVEAVATDVHTFVSTLSAMLDAQQQQTAVLNAIRLQLEALGAPGIEPTSLSN